MKQNEELGFSIISKGTDDRDSVPNWKEIQSAEQL